MELKNPFYQYRHKYDRMIEVNKDEWICVDRIIRARFVRFEGVYVQYDCGDNGVETIVVKGTYAEELVKGMKKIIKDPNETRGKNKGKNAKK